MERRQFLQLVGSTGLLGAAGCLGNSGAGPSEQGPDSEPSSSTSQSSATATGTGTANVRQWARDADPKVPTRPNGEPIITEQTITDEPGYEDDIEYFPGNQTVRYVKLVSGGEPAAYDTWSFEEWGSIESAEVGAKRAETVTADRLGVEGVGSAISRPPKDAETDELVIMLEVTKTVNNDDEVVNWPVATFPAIKKAAPRSVDVTLTLEGDTVSRTVPVYVRYMVMYYA